MDPLPDSTDWLQTSLPLFAPLESSLRCEVCKEFYSNPVITTCSHTFCSLCVRRAISADGKCPACKAACQADKLLPNFAVREVVARWVEAREGALELARGAAGKAEEGEEAEIGKRGAKKRKAADSEVDGETEEERVRRTRSRVTRSSSQRGKGVVDEPFEIKDSEDESDVEYVPEGMVACPICSRHMKEEQVWGHLNSGNCPGEQNKASSARPTRSRAQNSRFLAPGNNSSRDASATARLPGINYSMMKEKDLKKKLQDLGIPAWGKKDLLIRRHTEWLHLWNSNCDASEDKRKSKRDLLRELDVWERTRGGRATASEAAVMRKDFDGKGHAEAHKSQFDELIAAARAKRGVPKTKEGNDDTAVAMPSDGGQQDEQQDAHQDEQQDAQQGERPAAQQEHQQEQQQYAEQCIQQDEQQGPGQYIKRGPQNGDQQNTDTVSRPYEGNEAALSTIQAKVAATNLNGTVQPPEIAKTKETPIPTSDTLGSRESGIQNPFGSPSKKLPMFAVPEDPVVDVEHSASIP